MGAPALGAEAHAGSRCTAREPARRCGVRPAINEVIVATLMAEPVLSVRQLVIGATSVTHPTHVHRVVDEVSFDVERGAVLGVLGESGSGKSLIGLAILRLLPGTTRAVAGQIAFEGRDLLQLSESEMRGLRGSGISMVFQEPASALSSSDTVAWHLEAALRAPGQRRAAERGPALRERALALLHKVELPDPAALLAARPFQLSAGMRRRLVIAMALAAKPRLLIADEPTTGLDAPVQAQILDLFARLAREEQLTALFISHDPEVVAEVASHVIVLHAGEVIEAGPARSVLLDARHPYTAGLVESARARRCPMRRAERRQPPAPAANLRTSDGCRFAARCRTRLSAPERFPRCETERPKLETDAGAHQCRCFYWRVASAAAHG